ncbi:unnamed protein product [Gongylonema pulchrum]|uniref:ZP domain-containing protein n=1 Tax=Gongylonema pulchrum TaxID=637853 RepID=A0A183E4A9_9BILA|nr:unnamed protein product [Gongylonema pulchrum]
MMRSRHWSLLFFHAIIITLNCISGAIDQQIDVSMVCKPGYRVFGIQRPPLFNGKLSSLTVQCELIEPDAPKNSCINDRLNQPSDKFEHGIAGDLVYRGVQCWHQYNANNTLFDLIWKMEICPFRSPLKNSHRPQGCPECECDCGKARCTDGSYPAKLIHKYPQTQSCQCRCDCTVIC